MATLDGSLYSLPHEGAEQLSRTIEDLSARVDALRDDRRLSQATLKAYYSEKRFEVVAESNAIEGSPLTVGETKLAVERGITIGGHDPAYSRDARSLHGAITELERVAKDREGYDPVGARLRRAYENQLELWETGVAFLGAMLEAELSRAAESSGGDYRFVRIDERLVVDDFMDMLKGMPPKGRSSWRFDMSLSLPTLGQSRHLVWVGFRSDQLRRHRDMRDPGPSLFFSRRNPNRYPPWLPLRGSDALGLEEVSLRLPQADSWVALYPDGTTRTIAPTDAAKTLVAAIVDSLVPAAE